jgi:hypothetical protein
MTPRIIAFVGENANGILRWWTQEILNRLTAHGFDGALIDLRDPDWVPTLSAELDKGAPPFCFSFQGMGMNLAVDGKNFWEAGNIPFLSVMGDSPCYMPRLHMANPRIGYLLYSCSDFYDAYRTYLKGPALAMLQPYGFPANPHAEEIPWESRSNDVVYVKTGVDPDAISRQWEALPWRVRTLIDDAVGAALSGSDATIPDLAAGAFAAASIHWAERTELFWLVTHQVDMFVRARRAAAMMRALMRHPGVRVHGNWDFLDTSSARARFLGPIPADQLPALYADTRMVANVSPCVRNGVHERVLAGLMAKALVLSDSTPFARDRLALYPAYRAVDVDAADLDDQVAAEIANIRGMQDAVEPSYARASQEFALDNFIAGLFDALAVHDLLKRNPGYRPDAV